MPSGDVDTRFWEFPLRQLVLLCHKYLRWVMLLIHARFGGARGSTRRWVSE